MCNMLDKHKKLVANKLEVATILSKQANQKDSVLTPMQFCCCVGMDTPAIMNMCMLKHSLNMHICKRCMVSC